jgi:hypothetical protein
MEQEAMTLKEARELRRRIRGLRAQWVNGEITRREGFERLLPVARVTVGPFAGLSGPVLWAGSRQGVTEVQVLIGAWVPGRPQYMGDTVYVPPGRVVLEERSKS